MTRRRSLTTAQRVRIFDSADGCCHICKCKIKTGEPWEADHVTPRVFTGSDDLKEFKPAHVDCHKDKTRKDNRAAKKSTRQRAKHLGIKTRRGRPMVGTKASGLRKRMDGTMERRDGY